MTEHIVKSTAIFAVSAGLFAGCEHLEFNESDVKISMNELPPAVKPQAEKEVVGCQIKEVEKEIEKGQVVYAITYFDKAGVLMEVEYAEDGTLISKGKE